MCIWKVMADSFDFDDIEITQLVYQNYPVKRFMDAKQSMGISACKGMGKTFLLKAKRMRLQKENDSSILFLPKNQLVDAPAPCVLDQTHISFLKSYNNWVALWIGCISIYLLSQDEFSSLLTEENVRVLSETVRNLLKTPNNGVYSVLGQAIALHSQKMLRDIVQNANLLFALVQNINRPIALFVDKLEEPFDRSYYRIPGSTLAAEGRFNASIWAYAQLAFAEAVYVFYSARHHLKIFFGIRQEALAGAEGITSQFTKIKSGLIVKLEYSFSDLRKMFAQYVEREKSDNLLYPDLAKKDPVKALCGISVVRHRSGMDEQMWAYIYRHSLQRPRDIMEMGQTLYENLVCDPDKDSRDELSRMRICRHWVNEISTRECREYIAGLNPFMTDDENIDFVEDVNLFLESLPTNVYTDQTVLSYCHKSNCSTSSISCPKCPNHHWFSTLYNIGLLGYIYWSDADRQYKNHIKPIGDSIFAIKKQTLPRAELYYAHPGLGNIIQQQRERALLAYFPSYFVINSSEVFANKEQIKRLKHFCAAVDGNENEKNVFLSSTGFDLSETRREISNYLKAAGYRVFAYEDDDFPPLKATGDPNQLHHQGETHDHCINVMLSCKHLIYIFAGRFGGQYFGNEFESYYKERSDIIKICPSISFMEYLVANKLGKSVSVYVYEKVEDARGEWTKNGSPNDYKSRVVDDIRVFKQLGYFNSLGNGTWLNKYYDYSSLVNAIKKRFPTIQN